LVFGFGFSFGFGFDFSFGFGYWLRFRFLFRFCFWFRFGISFVFGFDFIGGFVLESVYFLHFGLCLGATYENGYTKDDLTIKYFWQIVHDFSLEERKKLLFFTTGSDRSPIGGLGKMEFIIMKHGDDGNMYDCIFNSFSYFSPLGSQQRILVLITYYCRLIARKKNVEKC
jgi:hypothetical protein